MLRFFFASIFIITALTSAHAVHIPDPARSSAMYYEYHDVPTFTLDPNPPENNTFSWSLDNNGTSYVGPWENTATLALNHLLGQNSQIEIMNIAIPHDHNYKQWRLTFSYPLRDNTLSLLGGYLTIRNQPVNLDNSLSFRSQLDSFHLGLEKILRQNNHHLLKGQIRFAHKRLYNTINQTHEKDTLSMINATLNWSFHTSLHDTNILEVGLYQGISGRPFRHDNNDYPSRKGCTPGFTKFKFFFHRTHDFQSLPLGYTFLTHGQLAFNSLLAPERMPIAGAPIMNAYSFGTLIGDSAIESKFQLHVNLPSISLFQGLKLYTYITHGTIWNRKPTRWERKKSSLSATSLGVSGRIVEKVSWFAEYAWPHKKVINYETSQPALYVGFTVSI